MLDLLKCKQLYSMPHVTSVKSSPSPMGGNVDGDPHHLQNLNPTQTATEIQWMHSSATGIYRDNSEDTSNQALLLPHPGHLRQLNVLDAADDVEVNQKPCADNIHKEKISGDDAGECDSEKSREEVIKEIAVSSTAFIGPAVRPDPAIEKELSDFYKELEEIDHHDSVDGVEGEVAVTEGVSQSCEPATNPSSRIKTQENYHKHAYKPYPSARPQRHYESSGPWRPQLHNEMKWSAPDAANNQPCSWQHPPPPRLSYDPPRFQILGPRRFLPPPIPAAPMPPPYLPPPIPLNKYRQHDDTSWSPWERTHFPLHNETRLSASNCPESFERQERVSADRQPFHNTLLYHKQDQYQHNNGMPLVLILMRGLPGCGKSTLAKEILSSGPDGLILSTDDYFFQENGYYFDPMLLGNAHEWNQKRARDAMLDRSSPVIIDNTNVQAWEMKPYVALALECGYRVEFVEPDTRWKCDPVELEKRNTHRVPRESIAKMLNRFELPISVDIVMNSREPPHKSKERLSKPHEQRRYNPF